MGGKRREAKEARKTRSTRDSEKNGIKKKEFPTLKVKGENFYRDGKAAARLKLLNSGKPIRDRDGKIIKSADYQKTEKEVTADQGKTAPDKRWFGNTRVISQNALDHFREAIAPHTGAQGAFSVLLKRNKLPMSLIRDPEKREDGSSKPHRVNTKGLAANESMKTTFGKHKQRKRVRLEGDSESFADLARAGDQDLEGYNNTNDTDLQSGPQDWIASARESILNKGQSKRIWSELYKVIDSSDVILHVLDARDPLGTRCDAVVDYLRKEKSHKHLVFLLNKVDLVPTWVTSRWLSHLSSTTPTLAFHASINHSFGKGSLISLLRQFSALHPERKQISVGLIGYPNTGKSSIINTLRAKKVCTVAPIPGETKVWQYITLMKRIYLVDCPGIVPPSTNDNDTSIVLKGVVRVEALQSPSQYIPALLSKVKPIYISKTYGVPLSTWMDSEEGQSLAHDSEATEDLDTIWRRPADRLIAAMARKMGKLHKGGEPDVETVAKIILNDWLRGKIPYFTPPPPANTPKVVPEGVKNQEDKALSKKEAEYQQRLQAITSATLENAERATRKIPVWTSFTREDRAPGIEMHRSDHEASHAQNADTEVVARELLKGPQPSWEELVDEAVTSDARRLSPSLKRKASDELVEDSERSEAAGDSDLSDLEATFSSDEDEIAEAANPQVSPPATKTVPPRKEGPRLSKKALKAARKAELELEGQLIGRKRVEADHKPRMATGKQSKTNYYTEANVKNRNRERKIPKQRRS